MSYKRIFFFLASIAFCNASFGQHTPEYILDSASGKFITSIRAHEKERAYLVTDKSIFIAGENIWFKAFLLNSISQKISTRSKFLFVDLVDEKDSVIKVVILDAANKQLNSRIELAHSISTGNYWLRAYTRQMAEGDTGNICVKPIYVVGKTENNISNLQKNTARPDSIPTINFYPEGGSIITGANSTVALKASDNGVPISLSGYIKDTREAIVSRFKTNEEGLGKFDFEPSRNWKYVAIVNWHDKEISYPLPSFNFFAGQLSVTKQAGSYKLRVLLEDSIYRQDVLTYVIGVSKDSLVFAGIGRGLYEVSVDKQKLPEGITTFYLFDKSLKLLSERSIYVHGNNLQITAKTSKREYTKRDRVTLNLSIFDSAQHAVPSLIAISATDSTLADPGWQCPPPVPQNQEDIDNIFIATNECLTDGETELLMLLKNNTYETFSTPLPGSAAINIDSTLYIKGTALNEKDVPSANKPITLISNYGNSMVYFDTTDSKGHFIFPVENYKDSTQFGIQVRNFNNVKENTNIILDAVSYPTFSTPASLKQTITVQPKLLKKYINAHYDNDLAGDGKKSLPPVTVKYEKKTADYNEAKRVSPTSAILTSDDLDDRSSVANAILKVGGMHILNGVLVVNGLTSMKAPDKTSEPMLLIDGAEAALSGDGLVGESSPVISYLKTLNPKDIDFIEILKGPEGANYGLRGGNGVILVNMLTSRRELKSDGSNLKTFYVKGVSGPVLFPALDYEKTGPKTSTLSDNRSTLFWNGSFLIEETGDAAITFYTSDNTSTYKITIAGITIYGDIIHKTITFRSR